MRHLGEQITDFVFGELSSTEMDEARRHVAECADCRTAVEQFQHTHAMLKTSPDVEPPRRIVFEVEKRPSVFAWRWLAPIGVAAALVIAILIAAPMQIQWQESQMTITFGKLPAQPLQPPVAAVRVPTSVQPIDYERIARDVAGSQQTWLASEFKKRDGAQVKETQRLRDQLVYIEAKQHAIEIRGIDNTATLQFLAQRSGEKD